MELLLEKVRIFAEGKIEENKDIYIANGIIERIADGGTLAPMYPEAEVFTTSGLVVAGYIDLHTHGGGGHNCMEGTEEALTAFARYQLFEGVTTFMPTTVTASLDDIAQVMNGIRRTEQPYSRIDGVHLEGPFVNLKGAGAQNPEYIIPPTNYAISFVENNADTIKRITLAPDVQNAEFATKIFTEKGIKVSAGHDGAVYDEVMACERAGLNCVTHLFNRSSTATRRGGVKKLAGLTETALLTPIYAEIIGDGSHVPYPMVELAFKCKGADKILLVSDSLSVAGFEGEGDLYLGSAEDGQKVEIKEGVCCLMDGTIAGSVTSVSKMVVGLLANTSISKEDILRSATLSPAEMMGYTDRGDIKEKYLADLNILAEDGTILNTIFKGRFVR